MKSKEEIVSNWLPRYTGEKLENFGEYSYGWEKKEQSLRLIQELPEFNEGNGQ